MTEKKPPHEYASSPCMMHETDPAWSGLDDEATLKAWRRAERERLIALRLAMPPEERTGLSEKIAATLDERLGDIAGRRISLYWPFRGEPDLRGWMRRAHERGAACLLPVVVKKAAPLIFRRWRPGCAMERGVWNIPIPAGDEEKTPEILIAPLVGFDAAGYRLGYGGGFYDRTIAALPHPAEVIGVGYDAQRVESIRPQWHDVPMTEIITGAGAFTPERPAQGG